MQNKSSGLNKDGKLKNNFSITDPDTGRSVFILASMDLDPNYFADEPTKDGKLITQPGCNSSVVYQDSYFFLALDPLVPPKKGD